MRFSDIDLYEMPDWMQIATVKIMNQCGEMVKRNPKYYEYLKEGETLLAKNRFISEFLSTIVEPKKMEDLPMPTEKDLKELSRYLALESDQMEFMNMQYYLVGSLHTLEYLELLGIL